MAAAGSLRDWIEALPERGRYVFTRADASGAADVNSAAIKMTLYRLQRSGAIVSPRLDIRTAQALLVHSDVKTTMIYTHVLNRGPAGVRSSVDALLGEAR